MTNNQLKHEPRYGARSPLSSTTPAVLASRFRRVRLFTTELALPLAIEDHVVQSMPDVSPTKWHLAHTTWFFEQFILAKFVKGYEPVSREYDHLFNSYYETLGKPFSRPNRGLLSRPTVAEVLVYRRSVDERVQQCLAEAGEAISEELAFRLELGMQHEQQHQELILTDIKHVFSCNPLRPSYLGAQPSKLRTQASFSWVEIEGGTKQIGHAGASFGFDYERPAHELQVRDFQLANRPVTCGEYPEFMADGGYDRPELWLADGWTQIQREGWNAPLYWEGERDTWHLFTLRGVEALDHGQPVSHVSFYEADAFARWKGVRLPSEAELEVSCRGLPVRGNFMDSYLLHPRCAQEDAEPGLLQVYGDVWEWTHSPYTPYPGFKPLAGAIGEYNGKFMCNQMVLRGGSCATSRDHMRPTYRNFFYPAQRWQFTGIRLAKDS